MTRNTRPKQDEVRLDADTGLEGSTLSDTRKLDIGPVAPAAAPQPAPPAPPGAPKFCCVCKKEITRRKRFKDRFGRYYCKVCARLSDQARRSITFTCEVCRRPFVWQNLYHNDGRFLCTECYKASFDGWTSRQGGQSAPAVDPLLQETERLRKRMRRSLVIMWLIYALLLGVLLFRLLR